MPHIVEKLLPLKETTSPRTLGSIWMVIVFCALCVNAGASPATFAADTPAPVPAGLTDPHFKEPYIDVDEWRDKPVRHRYVHGGFKGTQARFGFYFPPKEQYQGRFFQYVTPTPASEEIDAQALGSFGAAEHMIFSLASGAYFVHIGF